jgi:hypothetical protein
LDGIVSDEEVMTKKKEDGIVGKLYSMALEMQNMGRIPYISIPIFKAIISDFRIPQRAWFKIGKKLESEGYVKMCGTSFVLVRLSHLAKVYPH